jgi:hypothetical protein
MTANSASAEAPFATMIMPSPVSHGDSPCSDELTLAGPVEHVGGTSSYFEELDNPSHLPSSFRRVVDTSPSFHRIELNSTGRVLSPATTSLADVVAVVGPHADLLMRVYFQTVHPLFPACTLEDLSLFIARLAAIKDSEVAESHANEDKALAPLVACVLILAAKSVANLYATCGLMRWQILLSGTGFRHHNMSRRDQFAGLCAPRMCHRDALSSAGYDSGVDSPIHAFSVQQSGRVSRALVSHGTASDDGGEPRSP